MGCCSGTCEKLRIKVCTYDYICIRCTSSRTPKEDRGCEVFSEMHGGTCCVFLSFTAKERDCGRGSDYLYIRIGDRV